LAVLQKKREKNEGLTISLRKSRESSTEISGSTEIVGEGNLVNASDLSFFNYDLVLSATNFFSEENKLGQGGFGPVYKVCSWLYELSFFASDCVKHSNIPHG